MTHTLKQADAESSDAGFRHLWTCYVQQLALYNAARHAFKQARATFDAEVPGGADDILNVVAFGDSLAGKQRNLELGMDRSHHEWSREGRALGRIVKAIRKAKPRLHSASA